METLHLADQLLYFAKNAEELAAVRAHLRQNPATFGACSSDIARARPLTVPKDAPVVFAS